MSETIIKKSSLDMYKNDMITYAIETNRRRSVPDARDGLKLIHRRILDAMFNHETCATSFIKSSAVIGTVMKVSHPHGDAAIGDAMKPMANWFEIMEPLITPHGNYGSMQGDGAAAPRYTEVKLSPFALDCVIADLKQEKNIVDWVETFDGRHMEPEFLPVAVPLLLINGCFGIGIGLRSEIPKHNLAEVIDATINLIKNPNADVVLIPDHCMKCEIIDTNWKSISNKGRGKYKARAVIDIEKVRDRYNLIIKSIPDRVFFDKGAPENGGVKYKILDMVKAGRLPQITDIQEDSHGNDMRIVIKLRKGSDPNYVREMLYKNTQLEDTYSVNFEVLNGLTPLRMSYKSYLQFFIEQRKMIKFVLYCNKLQTVKTKWHEKDAYIKVLESGEIDNIIKMIQRQSSINEQDNIEYLIDKLNITDLQAKFILNSSIKSLSMGYLNKYKKEAEELNQLKDIYTEKILNEDLILKEIIDELKYFKKKYGRPRNCKIIKKEDTFSVPKGEFKIVVTENNFIKKILPNERPGTSKGYKPKFVLRVDNTQNILLFAEQGKVFKLPVHKIPVTPKGDIGIDIRILIKGLTSNINKIIYEPLLNELSNKLRKYFITIVTANNYIKKLDVEDFLNVPLSGILYTKLNDGDYVKDIIISNNDLDIIIYSNKKALRVNMEEIPHYKRNTLGVLAMNTKEEIDGLSVIYPDSDFIVVITNSGKVNKFDSAGLLRSNRYKAGSSVIRLGKNDSINSIFGANDNNIITVTTNKSKFDIDVSELALGSSISSGNKIIPGKEQILKCELFKKN